MKTKTFLLLTISCLVFLFSLSQGYSQTPPQMLLPLIEGNQYQLKHYDKNGKLESYRKLKISKIQKTAQDMEVEITSYNYDENPTPQDSVRTSLACSNSAENMAMSLLAFLGGSGDGKLKLAITSSDELFPANLSNERKLKNIYVEVEVEEGVFSFFGAKSKIMLRNRKLTLMESAEPDSEKTERYKLTSQLLIQGYALGINVKNIVYRVEEVVDVGKGLVRQVAKASDGSYFDLELIAG